MKSVVYRYNGDPSSDEPEVDIDEDVNALKKGDVLERKGKRWKVAEINTEVGVSVPKPVDIVRIFLIGPV